MSFSNCVLDLSHFNTNVDFHLAHQSGIAGVIHKATQGMLYCDPAYAPHKIQAEDEGMLWGAYHFGVGGDGIAQAEYFLNTVRPGPQTLLALDLEANPQGPSMGLKQARAFVSHVQAVTGKFPGLYAGYYLKSLLAGQTDVVLANCWFWLSQYGEMPVVPANWKTWTLWQYTDGAMGPQPHDVPGVGRCDRNRFNGSEGELREWWGAARDLNRPATAPQN